VKASSTSTLTASSVVTRIDFVPGVLLGVLHSSSVPLTTNTSVHGKKSTSTFTWAFHLVPCPKSLISVPPEVGPLFGSA
jgi:hypothetical protein